jgi:hypothetical protein
MYGAVMTRGRTSRQQFICSVEFSALAAYKPATTFSKPPGETAHVVFKR